MSDRKVYVVIIEWMGQAPPTVWYNRLEDMTGVRARSRRSKGKGDAPRDIDTILEKTADPRFSDYGALAQEGAIICSSHSLARTVAGMAMKGFPAGKGKNRTMVIPDKVILAEMNVIDFALSKEDEAALRRIENVHGKRGRPAADSVRNYAVTCMEELESYEKEARGVANCPHCGGTQIRVRQGDRETFADPGGEIWQAWLAMRFAHGYFEIPAKGETAPPPTPKLSDLKESETVARLISSALMPEINALDREEAFRVLDALFVARAYWSKDRRTDERLAALMNYFKRGGSPLDVSLAEPENDFDWFDLAGPLGSNEAIYYAMLETESATNAVPEMA